MPIVVFQYTSSSITGDAATYNQTIPLRYMPPRGSRFILKQVSAISNVSVVSSFKYLVVHFPQLMSGEDKTMMQFYTIDPLTKQAVPSTNMLPGIRYYVTDLYKSPVGINTYPHLNLGRHHLNDPFIHFSISAFNDTGAPAPLYSYNVVLEWDTE